MQTKARTRYPVPLDIGTDYPRYVNGKPRYDGVTWSFYRSEKGLTTMQATETR